jgi:hypothetical protein
MDLKKGLLISGTIAILMIAVVVVAQGNNKQSKSLVPEESDPEYSKKFNFHLIPDGKGNYRSAQFTEKELPYIIKKYNIKRIIRHNGDGGDSRHRSTYPETSRAKEKAICEANGCEHYMIPSYHGYKAGQGYAKSVDNVTAILDKGNTLIHCAHGADRTGGMVGGYLKKRGYMTNLDQLWEYTTQYNGWNRMIKGKRFFGSGFDKYADSFYPISLLKNSKWVK